MKIERVEELLISDNLSDEMRRTARQWLGMQHIISDLIAREPKPQGERYADWHQEFTRVKS